MFPIFYDLVAKKLSNKKDFRYTLIVNLSNNSIY